MSGSQAGGGRGIGPWVVSLTGVMIADISFWFLVNFKFFDFSQTPLIRPTFILKLVELLLMIGFAGVLIFAGYWLATSDYNTEESWWVSLWSIIGLTGIVTVIVLVQAHHVAAGIELESWMLAEELLMGAGGGGVAGLLIGLSTARAMRSERTVASQRNAFAFLNRFLRHHVLNGVQVIQGQAHLLTDRVDEGDRHRIEVIEERSEAIADLTQNARVVAETISGEATTTTVDLSDVLVDEIEDAEAKHEGVEFAVSVPDDVRVKANESLPIVLENVLRNAVVHNDRDTPQVDISVETENGRVIATIADNGPGIPDDRKQSVFQPDGPANDGFGLYLGKTIIDHYDGNIWIEDNDPRGAVFKLEFERQPGSA